ncbi:SAM domain-containing protein [Streptomyces sp. NPDC058272]|uniref:SAM domain-containing protein n=1 Tax=Streptomyces sp. NPDC058272 TaxID=3346415 RepID=UPI0036F00CBD
MFLHGIGGIRDPERERREWLEALAAGARKAGHADAVSGLTQGWLAEVRFADYSDLFVDAEAQGDQVLALDDQEDAVFLEEFVEALIDELGVQSVERDDRRALAVVEDARSQLPRFDGEAQGVGAPIRVLGRVLTTLLQIPGLRGSAQWASGLPLLWYLAQVGRYLGRQEADGVGRTLDQRIRERVLRGTDPDRPLIVVSHSLGTVVAFEALCGYRGPVPLLMTLGSPLATGAAVLQRLVPQPPRTPGRVERWLNFWDRDDIVVGRPRIQNWMLPNASGVLPVTERVDSDGLWVHSATKYLQQPAVAGPLVEALKK